MPGFMQFITGVYLLVGLTWFNVFGKEAPLCMAGLAFTAYGIKINTDAMARTTQLVQEGFVKISES